VTVRTRNTWVKQGQGGTAFLNGQSPALPDSLLFGTAKEKLGNQHFDDASELREGAEEFCRKFQ